MIEALTDSPRPRDESNLGRCEADDPDDAPIEVYRVLRRHPARARVHLRRGVLSDLDGAAWAVFTAISDCWAVSVFAPSRRELHELAGASTRDVTRQVAVLCDRRVLRVRRSPGSVAEYLVGPRIEGTLQELALEIEPRLWPFRATTGVATVASPPSVNPGQGGPTWRPMDRLARAKTFAPPRFASERRVRDLEKEERTKSSFVSGREVQRLSIARAVLTAWFQRLYPERAVPTTFARADLDLVTACMDPACEDAGSLEAQHRDAIEGAIASSRGRPPTVRYIWGRLEYFLAHASNGRARREGQARCHIARAPSRRARTAAHPPEDIASPSDVALIAASLVRSLR